MKKVIILLLLALCCANGVQAHPKRTRHEKKIERRQYSYGQGHMKRVHNRWEYTGHHNGLN